MNYPDSVRFLYALGNEIKTAKLGLDRITRLLNALGNPHLGARFVHVAGTNGKGSTCALIESGLRAAGLKTGLFTSPHLLEPTERIQIGGSPISTAEFGAAFNQVHSASEELLRTGVLDLHPTYFETVTAMGLLAFRERNVDVAVIEVGLGGRLDATNVLVPQLAVITPIDFDHEAFLGKSLQAIAGEKAGILKRGVPAVFSTQRPEAAQVLECRSSELGIEVIRAADREISNLEVGAYASEFDTDGLHIRCALAGEHQVGNAVTAIAALQRLGVPAPAIQRGIAEATWPGRLERVSSAPEIILDGAHNPAGARALARHIERFYSDRRVWLIYGAMRDKAVAESTGILFPLAREIVLTAPDQTRALRPEAIREFMEMPHLRVAARLADALEVIRREASPGDAVFITGSLFLVGEAKALL
jgi:dihydrofolate synthase / folylpolyglutamate synthase